MPPKKDSTTAVDELISALSDKRVIDAIAGILDAKLNIMMQTVVDLSENNKRMTNDIAELKDELKLANTKIEYLESYNRLDNLIIVGLPVNNYAEAAAVSTNAANTESSAVTETAVLDFVNNKLNVPLTPSDISFVHRLKSKPREQTPPNVIIRFTNRKARNAVFAARRQLRVTLTESSSSSSGNAQRIYINEDLTKNNADLYRRVRQLVKQKRLSRCWTAGGAVFVKKSAESQPMKLSTSSDLTSV